MQNATILLIYSNFGKMCKKKKQRLCYHAKRETDLTCIREWMIVKYACHQYKRADLTVLHSVVCPASNICRESLAYGANKAKALRRQQWDAVITWTWSTANSFDVKEWQQSWIFAERPHEWFFSKAHCSNTLDLEQKFKQTMLLLKISQAHKGHLLISCSTQLKCILTKYNSVICRWACTRQNRIVKERVNNDDCIPEQLVGNSSNIARLLWAWHPIDCTKVAYPCNLSAKMFPVLPLCSCTRCLLTGGPIAEPINCKSMSFCEAPWSSEDDLVMVA